MAPKSFLFTNSPFLPSQVPLASFVPYKSQPHQDAETPYIVTTDDYSVQPDEDFDGLIESNSDSSLSAVLTKFFSLSLRHQQSTTLHLNSLKGYIYSLKQPEKLFNKVVFEDEQTREEMQQRLESWRRRKIQPRFVVAYRTFVDANIERDEHRSTDVASKGGAPISTAQGDLTGAADVDLQAGHSRNRSESHDMTAKGERIYAICYRKVEISSRCGEQLTLNSKSQWKSFGTRGEEETPRYYQADLMGEDELDGFERHEVKASDGGVLTIGLPAAAKGS